MKTATREILIGLLFCVCFPVAGLLRAQEEPLPKEPAGTTREESGSIDPLLLEPGDLVNRLRSDLVFWPDEKGQKAADMIFRAGPETIEYLMKILKERDYRIKPAAADLLGRFDHRDAWEAIRVLLDHAGLKSKVKHLFKSLHRLDPEKTYLLCEELLEGKKRTLRKSSFNFLFARKDLKQRKEKLVLLIDSKDADVRRHGFLLLGKADLSAAELRPIVLKLVGDEDARLAGEVLTVVSLLDDGEVTAGLVALLESPDDRRKAHSLLALAMREFNLGEAGVPAAMAGDLEDLLKSRNPLLKVGAASGLTVVYLRSGEGARARQGRIVSALMEVFLGSLYCKDFSSLLDVSVRCLRNLTGEPFTRDLTFWKKWWNEEGGSFQQDQKLLSLADEDLDRLVITFRRNGRPYPVLFRIAGEALIKNTGFQRTSATCFAREVSLSNMVKALYAGGFFEKAAAAGTVAAAAGTGAAATGPAAGTGDDRSFAGSRVTIELSIDGRAIGLTVSDPLQQDGKEANSQLLRIVDAVRHVFNRNAWQLLYGDLEFEAWYFDNVDWWDAGENEAARTRRFLERFILIQNLLSEDALLACLDWLCGRADIGEHFGTEEWGELARRLRGRGSVDKLVRGTVSLVLAAEPKAVGSGDSLFEPLADYLFVLFRERSIPIIEEMVFERGRIGDSLRNDVWYVRAAAARVLRRLETNTVPQLVSMLNDDHPIVRVEALRSLALAGTTECRDIILGVLERNDIERVLEVLVALDGVRASWVFSFLEERALTGSDAMRAAAMKAIARFTGPKAEELIVGHLGSEGSTDGWPAAAIELLVEAGGTTARNALFRFFGESSGRSLLVAEALADLGDTRVVPALLEFLEGSERSKSVEKSLSLLLAADCSGETRLYRKLWEENPGKSQSFFLGRTLAEEIEAVGTGTVCYEGIPVSLLVRSLSDARWYVRLAALRILEEGSGETFGSVGRNVGMLDMNQVRYDWEAWLGMR
jgi:HEAT repeat protein